MLKEKEVKMNKKGVTHFEMIVALILFILVVFGVLAVYNSHFKSNELERTSLDLFEQSFMKHADNFTEVDAFVNLPAGDCFNISLNSNLDALFERIYVLAGNVKANFILSPDGRSIFIENKNAELYSIYAFSFETGDKTLQFPISNCVNVPTVYGTLMNERIFSSKKLDDFRTNYTNDYENLKNQWDLQNDFAITINDVEGGNWTMSKDKPVNTNVLAKSFMIKVFKENRIVNAVVSLQIW